MDADSEIITMLDVVAANGAEAGRRRFDSREETGSCKTLTRYRSMGRFQWRWCCVSSR